MIRVAALELDEASGEARFGGRLVRIRSKPFDVLGRLARTPGRSVPKAELLEEVWPDQVVSDAALTSAVREVRRALKGLGASTAIQIESIRGRGYRLVVPETDDEDVSRAVPVEARPGDVSFVGRASELERLRTALDDVLGGAPRTAFLAGAAGIGKSRLAAHFSAASAAHDIDVFWGRCHEGPQPPLWPWAEIVRSFCQSGPEDEVLPILRPVASELGRVLPTVRAYFEDVEVASDPDPEVARLGLFDAFVVFFGRITRRRPCLLVLDDLQWADPSSLLLLSTLSSGGASGRMMVVGTYRDDEIQPDDALSSTLTELERDPAVEMLALGPLSEEESRTLVGTVGGPVADRPRVEEICRIGAGNPFFLEQLSRHVDESGENGPLPEAIERLLLRRLRRRSEGACRLIAQAAVIGIEFRTDLLRALAELDEASFRDQLDELMRAGLIEAASDGGEEGLLQFTHTLLRRAAYLETPAGARAALHLAIAERLEAESGSEITGDRAADLAHHFDLASDLAPPERVLHYRRLASTTRATPPKR